MIKNIIIATALLLTGCAGFEAELKSPTTDNTTYFPIASATVNVSSYGDLASLKYNKTFASLIIPQANAVAQGSATVSVTYNNPSATAFTVNTSSFGNAITLTGDTLNLGSITLASLNDNTLRVCTGVGAPANKCNRLYIRVFTLGSTPGFINTDAGYSIDVFAAGLPSAIGVSPSATAASVPGAATVYTYTIPNGMNRVRLSNLSAPAIPITADVSNAGSGSYSMSVVIQYALGYAP